MSIQIRGAVYGILAASIWGGAYVVSDIVLETIPPFTLLTLRLVLGIVVLVGLSQLQVKRKPSLPRPRVVVQMLMVGFVGYGLSLGAQFVGTDWSTAVNGALITTASPAFILLFAPLILHEPLSARLVGAVALSILGVIIIVDPANTQFGSETFRGDLTLVFAAVMWGLYSVLVRWVSQGHDTLTVTIIGATGALLLAVPLAVWELAHTDIGNITPAIYLGVIYLGGISTAGAMWYWNRAFALVEASSASLFFFAQPLVGSLLGIIILKQTFTLNLMLGAMAIVCGVMISMMPARPKRTAFMGHKRLRW
jgi:drug/metabolite transporter (DMT)-like permease